MISCLGIGLSHTRDTTCIREFTLGYKTITGTALFCSLLSSVVGAGSTLGVAEKTYLFGVSVLIVQIFRPIAWVLMSLIIPKGIEMAKDSMTLGDIMDKFYGPIGRCIASFTSVLLSYGAMVVQGIAMGYLFNYFFDIAPVYGVILGYTILISYSVLGGVNAVVQTEVFKSSIFYIFIPASFAIASIKIGGFSNFIQTLPKDFITINSENDTYYIILGLIFYTILPQYDAAFISRCLMVPDAKKLRSSLQNIAILYVPFSITFCAIAYLVKSVDPAINSKDVVFYYIDYFLPIGMKGIMIAGIFAIMMGFAEAQLGAAGVIITHDILGKILSFKIPPKTQVQVVRLCILLLGTSSFLFVSHATNTELINIALAVFNFYDPLITIPLTAAFLGMNVNRKSFIASLIFAISFILIGRIYAGEFAILTFILGMLGSFIGFFGMHFTQIIFNGKGCQLATNLKSVTYYASEKFNFLINLFRKEPQDNKYKEFVILTLGSYFICSMYICFVKFNLILLYMMIIGYIMCVILLGRDFVFTHRLMRRHLVLYWNIVVIYCLPFMSTYILLTNNGDDFWVINGILCAFSLYFFLEAIQYIFFYLIGAVLAVVFFLLIHVIDYYALIGAGYVLGFIVLTSLNFLRSRERENEDKLESMELFGGAIAHEVRGPLATLNMGAQKLAHIAHDLQNKKSSAIFKKDLKEIVDTTNMIDRVTLKGIKTVENLLTSLKKGSAAVEDSKSVNNILDVVNYAIDESMYLHNFKNPPKIECKNDFNFLGSKYLLKNVIYNLLSNSYKYVGPNVKVSMLISENKLIFQDNGPGIPKEHIDHIFQKFYTKGGKSGTGIGLAFCKMVIEDLGGTITCKSEIGLGTTFTINFPNLA